MAPTCNRVHPCEREAEKDLTQTHRRGGDVMMEAEIEMARPWVTECWQPPQAGRGKARILPSSVRGSETLLTP